MANLSVAQSPLLADHSRGNGCRISDTIFEILRRWLKMGQIEKPLSAITVWRHCRGFRYMGTPGALRGRKCRHRPAGKPDWPSTGGSRAEIPQDVPRLLIQRPVKSTGGFHGKPAGGFRGKWPGFRISREPARGFSGDSGSEARSPPPPPPPRP